MRPSIDRLILDANLGGIVGCVIADARSGEVLVERNASIPLPPASVTKAVTALYAIDILGGNHRFETRLIARGDVDDGVLKGDLILLGGGDPVLNSDHLAELADQMASAGIRQVSGRFLCWRGAVPYAEEIEPSQLDYLGYNPAVSGLNVNFNRVHFEWKRVNGSWQTSMDARTENRVPRVDMARVRIVDRASPVFVSEGPDEWSVSSAALGNGGSRWMPVRQPALYAGSVFQAVADDAGISVPSPIVIDDLPSDLTEGREVGVHRSPTLRTICRDMLRFSTNLTAEICGLAATASTGEVAAVTTSAARMSDWVGATYGVETDFRDHSGLSDENRITARAMTQILLQEGPNSELRQILREIPMIDAERNRIDNHPVSVRAKTGTLNFVSSLSGYVRTEPGDDLVFTFLTANLERRARGKAGGAEVPEGAIAWNRRSKRFQQQVLQRWGLTSRPVPDAASADPLGPSDVRPGGVALDAIMPDLDQTDEDS